MQSVHTVVANLTYSDFNAVYSWRSGTRNYHKAFQRSCPTILAIKHLSPLSVPVKKGIILGIMDNSEILCLKIKSDALYESF